MNRFIGVLAIVAAAGASYATHAAEGDIFKPWKTHKGGYVEFAPCEADQAKVCGTISALAPDHSGPPPLDVNNPDPALQGRELLGLEIFWDFEYKGKDRWKNGTIYNTDDGKEYDSKLKIMDDGRLKVSGCVIFFCQSYEWAPAGTQAAGAVAE